MVFLACLVPWVCHSVNRVCYVSGELVHDQVLGTSNVLSTLGQVDHVANQLSKAELQDIDHGFWHKSELIHLPQSLCYLKY
jgi:hypothetical protein